MDMDMPFQLMDMLLPELPMVDMLIMAMGMDMLLLATDMLLPELPMENMLLLAMDMLLLATDMDMLLSTTDRSTMGKDMDNNKFANT